MSKVDELISRLMGRPISLRQMMLEATMRDWRASWKQQVVEERRRRMHFVLELSRELLKLRDAGVNHATMWCEICIEAVINGDADSLRMAMSTFDFKGDDVAYTARWVPVFVRFKEICEEARLTAGACQDEGEGRLKA